MPTSSAGCAICDLVLAQTQTPNPNQSAPAQAGIEPNTIKRRGTGFRGYDSERASPRYTLFTPGLGGGMVQLIDLQGGISHTWNMPYPPGLYGYLTDRGTLFYNGRIPNDTFLGKQPWQGGVALEVDWNGRVLWEVRQPDHHHDGRLLANGNVLLLCARPLPEDVAQQVKGGIPGTEDNGTIYGDYLLEMTTAGQTVWEWRIWDHLDPATHPITLPSDTRAEWTHGLFGRLFEVTSEGDVVWEYVNPYFGPAAAPPKSWSNRVFRAYRYTADEIERARSA